MDKRTKEGQGLVCVYYVGVGVLHEWMCLRRVVGCLESGLGTVLKGHSEGDVWYVQWDMLLVAYCHSSLRL